MVKEDIHRLDKKLKSLEAKYFSKNDVLNGDKEEIKSFYTDLLASGFSKGRVSKCLCVLATLNRKLGKSFRSTNAQDIKELFVKIESEDYSDWYKHDFKVIFRKYMRFIGMDEVVSWIKVKDVKSSKMPEEVLKEKEIKAIAETAYSFRDTAFVLALYESGCRIGEFLPLKLKHVNFDKHGAVIRVNGKTGPRRIRLVFSTINLQRWIDEHPAKNNPEAYLWCKTPSQYNPKWKNKHLSYGFVSRKLKELSKKAGVKKAVNAHAFRHARATFMARHLKEPEMREFFGWGRNSEMTSIYVHLSGRDVDNSVLSIYGIKEGEKSQEPVLKIHECPRCKDVNDPAAMFCHTRVGYRSKKRGLRLKINWKVLW